MSRREFSKRIQRDAFHRAAGRCENCGCKLTVGKDCASYLRECLSYDSETGSLRWRKRPREHFASERAWRSINSRQYGAFAGSVGLNGYLTIRVGGVLMLAHRVAWMVHYGQCVPPGFVIDHRNRDRADNSIYNLRLADLSLNSQNRSVKSGKSLPLGVFADKERGKFMVSVTHAGRSHFGGRFDSAADADAAAQSLRLRLHGGSNAA